eukprot:TRINITY_DN1145_c0_g1_i1.p1 TRINITY_DN1145_c0_g1~~TRINITY_DN1145_c0_g1_i1.p1  ORF type:complete len:1708 (-),score=582.36 TRINITY_DN1145_c0_g1_i1:692-5815(-)
MATKLDKLNLATNSGFLKCIASFRNNSKNKDKFYGLNPLTVTEKVLFSGDLIKINRKGKRQKRALVITSLGIFNFAPKKFKNFKRRISLGDLDQVFLCDGTFEFVLHPADWSMEYDYQYDAGDKNSREEIVQILQSAFKELTGSILGVVDLHKEMVESMKRSKRTVTDLKKAAPVKEQNVGISGPKKHRKMSIANRLSMPTSLLGSDSGGMYRDNSQLPNVRSQLVESLCLTNNNASSLTAKMQKIPVFLEEILDKGDNCQQIREMMLKATNAVELHQMLCEMLLKQAVADELSWWFKCSPLWSEQVFECVAEGTGHNDAFVRSCAYKSLWCLCNMTVQEKIPVAKSLVPEGVQYKDPHTLFNIVVLQTMPSIKPEKSDYLTFLEITLDTISKPSQKVTKVETLGRTIATDVVLPPLFRLVDQSDFEIRQHALKDFNFLLLKKTPTYSMFLKNIGNLGAFNPLDDLMWSGCTNSWQSWVLPFFATVAKNDRTEDDADFLKTIMNVFASIFIHVFGSDRDLAKDVGSTVDEIARFAGWHDEAIYICRSLLNLLLSKVGSSCRRWKLDAEKDEWENMFKVIQAVEDFIFFRPVREIDGVLEESSNLLIPHPDPTSLPPPPSKTAGDVGVHIDSEGNVKDIQLVQRVLKILTALGIKEGAESRAADRKLKTRLKHGFNIMKKFSTIAEFFGSMHSKDEKEKLQAQKKVAEFLEKLAKTKSSGFISRGKGKKAIASSLKVSMMRQAARKQIQKEIKRVSEERKKAIIIENDIDLAKLAQKQTAMIKERIFDENDDEVHELPNCTKCGESIPNEELLESMGGHFHADCFCCCECDLCLAGKNFFEQDGHSYCKDCYLIKFDVPMCAGCLNPLRKGEQAMEALGRMWHPDHFCCTSCRKTFGESEVFYTHEKDPYCADCNTLLFMTCPSCKEVVDIKSGGVCALNRNWHRDHFCCTVCQEIFRDGVFFSKDAEDGRGELPYCEKHFTELFIPKCNKCRLPIKDEGLVACDANWHTECFKCHQCDCEFPGGAFFPNDGIPYCEEHYYENFGTRCFGCKKVIKEDVLNALNETWHADCFTCQECHCDFPELSFFEREGLPYCEPHYKEKFCEKCPACNEYVMGDAVKALDSLWHPECLVCTTCKTKLTNGVHRGPDGKPYCSEHYSDQFMEKCKKCDKPVAGECIQALDAFWHRDCFVCNTCENPVGENILALEGFPYCQEHFLAKVGVPCAGCTDLIFPNEVIKALGQTWHGKCLVCSVCSKPFKQGCKLYHSGKKPLCEEHFLAQCPTCGKCQEPIVGPYLNALGRKWHKEHLVCFVCDKPFESGKMWVRATLPVCQEHSTGALPPEKMEIMKKIIQENMEKEQEKEVEAQRKKEAEAKKAAAEEDNKSEEDKPKNITSKSESSTTKLSSKEPKTNTNVPRESNKIVMDSNSKTVERKTEASGPNASILKPSSTVKKDETKDNVNENVDKSKKSVMDTPIIEKKPESPIQTTSKVPKPTTKVPKPHSETTSSNVPKIPSKVPKPTSKVPKPSETTSSNVPKIPSKVPKPTLKVPKPLTTSKVSKPTSKVPKPPVQKTNVVSKQSTTTIPATDEKAPMAKTPINTKKENEESKSISVEKEVKKPKKRIVAPPPGIKKEVKPELIVPQKKWGDEMEWEYTNAEGDTFGPFLGEQMRDWFEAQMLSSSLMIRPLDKDNSPTAPLTSYFPNKDSAFL